MRKLLRRGLVAGFTILELLVVISIIIVLAGLVVATSAYVWKKGARSRTEAEIAAIAAALESYKADNGIYPFDNSTNGLDARTTLIPSTYQAASLLLYKSLSADTNANRAIDPAETGKTYFTFKPNQLNPTDQTQNVTSVRDPFGNSYGYSTAANPMTNPTPSPSPVGYNPTYDLWSTAGYEPLPSPTPTPTPQGFWIKNW
jgi:type II secretory pathway pseudopilin PulG